MIRLGKKEDIEKIYEIHAKEYPEGFPEGKKVVAIAWFESFVDSVRSALFVYEINGEIAGYATITYLHSPFSGSVKINQITLAEEFRGKKLGKDFFCRLLVLIYEHVRVVFKVKLQKVTLTVSESNDPALMLYRKHLRPNINVHNKQGGYIFTRVRESDEEPETIFHADVWTIGTSEGITTEA